MTWNDGTWPVAMIEHDLLMMEDNLEILEDD
jgi:hypothetical protein